MNRERLNSKTTTESSENPSWDFHNFAYQGFKDDEWPDIEDKAILAEVNPYIEKIDLEMLKKVFDGWKERRYYYRKKMREEEIMAKFSDAECNVWADLFYLGTIFRDYLDTILNLKRPGKSGFQLLDSTEEEVKDMGRAMGWFNTSEHMVNIVGDRFDTKFDFLGSIAHEMWHAHQIQVIEEENSDRSTKYLEELRNYIGVKGDPRQSQNQLLEKEAYTFQHLFEQKLSEVMRFAPEMKEILSEDTNRKQGITLSLEDYIKLEEYNNHHRYYDDGFDCDYYH